MSRLLGGVLAALAAATGVLALGSAGSEASVGSPTVSFVTMFSDRGDWIGGCGSSSAAGTR